MLGDLIKVIQIAGEGAKPSQTFCFLIQGCFSYMLPHVVKGYSQDFQRKGLQALTND